MGNRSFYIQPKFLKQYAELTADIEKESAIIQYILTMFFGHEWFQLTVMPLRMKKGFFRVPDGLTEENSRVTVRLNQLAANVLNLWLWEVPGLDDFLLEFRDDPSEGRFAELCLATHMARCGTKFAFQKKTSTKGYDFKVTTSWGTDVAVEAKCRAYGTEFNANNIWSTLRKAVKEQLPQDMPCALFIYMPPELITPTQPMDDLAWRLFRKYGQVVSLVNYSMRLVPDGTSTHYWVRLREIENPWHRYHGINRIFRRVYFKRHYVNIREIKAMILEGIGS